MVTAIKIFLGIFILAGVAIVLYGCWELLGTIMLVRNSPERTRGIFLGYDEYVAEVTGDNHPLTDNISGESDTMPILYHPRFEFSRGDGTRTQVRQSKTHLIKYFTPGQEVEVILSPQGGHRLAGFFPLYGVDLCILLIGLALILVPSAVGKKFIPLLSPSAVQEMPRHPKERAQEEKEREFVKQAGERTGAMLEQIGRSRIGPFTVSGFLKGTGVLIAVMLVIALAGGLTKFMREMEWGADYRLVEALSRSRFDEARELILKKKGINTINQFEQSPLLLAVEKGQAELVRLLIEAGGDVNIQDKWGEKPLMIAIRRGNVEIVRLLLAAGASQNAWREEDTPVFQAILKGQDEIAVVLIESGCDLQRKYSSGPNRLTVGDLTVLMKKTALTELVRKRGGLFTVTGTIQEKGS